MTTSILPPLPQLVSLQPQVEDFLRALEPYMIRSQGGINYYILPPELNYLAQVEEDQGTIYPQEFTIIAAFDSKGLAGRTMIVPLPHIEGTWVREDLRKGRLGYTLLKEVEKSIAMADRTYAWAFADTNEREGYLERLGYEKQELTVWYKKLDQAKKEK